MGLELLKGMGGHAPGDGNDRARVRGSGPASHEPAS
jgi:hypothetical protein